MLGYVSIQHFLFFLSPYTMWTGSLFKLLLCFIIRLILNTESKRGRGAKEGKKICKFHKVLMIFSTTSAFDTPPHLFENKQFWKPCLHSHHTFIFTLQDK